MNAMIFEPYAAGHRLHFASLVCQAFESIGVDCIFATTQQTIESDEFATHLASHIASSQLFVLSPAKTDGRVSKIRVQARWMKDAVTQVQPDKFLIPTASQLSESLIYAWTRGWLSYDAVSIEALFLGPGYGYPQPTLRQTFLHKAQSMLERRLPVDRYSHLDPYQLAQINGSTAGEHSERFFVMPDPAPPASTLTKTAARQSLQIPTKGCYGIVTGGISARKGVSLLIQAIQQSRDRLPADARLLLAGKFEQGIRKQLAASGVSDRIVAIDRHLTDQELNQSFAAADFICAVQAGRQGSSGNAIRALVAGRPILTGQVGMVPRLVEQFKLGWCVPVESLTAFGSGLLTAFEMAPDYKPSDSAISLSHFFTEKNFKAHWTALTRQSLGMKPDPNYMSWSTTMSVRRDAQTLNDRSTEMPTSEFKF